MSAEREPPVASTPITRKDLAGWLVMMVGAAFLPGLVIALCVVAIVAVAHFVG